MSQSLIKVEVYDESHMVIHYLSTLDDNSAPSKMIVLKSDLKDLAEWLLVAVDKEDL